MSPQDKNSPLESCHAAEARLQEVEKLLLEPHPDMLDRCESELREVILILHGIVSAGKRDWDPETAAVFQRIKNSSGRLQRQIKHASNLWAGWLQLRMGTGYTERGRPVFGSPPSSGSFEA